MCVTWGAVVQGRTAPWTTSLTRTTTSGTGAGRSLSRWKGRSRGGRPRWWWALRSSQWLRACSWRRIVTSLVLSVIFVKGRITDLLQGQYIFWTVMIWVDSPPLQKKINVIHQRMVRGQRDIYPCDLSKGLYQAQSSQQFANQVI